MKQLLEALGLVALVQGALGLVQQVTGRLHGWGLVQRLGFLDGYEIYASATLLVLAFALFAAAESRQPEQTPTGLPAARISNRS